MLERTEYMPLEFLKKQKWSGSFQGMRFLLHKIERTKPELLESGEPEKPEAWLEAVVWKEPYSYEVTPEDAKLRNRFSFDEAGREAAITWLEEVYDSRKEEWQQARKWNWEQ